MVYDFVLALYNRFIVKKLFVENHVRFLKNHYDKELYGSIIILKNLVIVSKQKPLSADYIYEVLTENAGTLKPVYQNMLNLYRSEKREMAFDYLADALGSKSGRAFASILAKLDKINPSELVIQMEVFQEMMTEERMTSALKTAQRNSIIVTTWAAAGMFSLLINFIVVVVFLDTLDVLKHIF